MLKRIDQEELDRTYRVGGYVLIAGAVIAIFTVILLTIR